ncbi:Ribosomal protein L7 [Spironucleus salmonicida]|uniref:Ribosomal protein L7 n=1 Tax=Spironucleus salmonicida TaxID=348837 RepID=A0A9P8RXL2_9EUKA|nr:Ribosomal protein L7 [Spironucleus salmonicida]
MNSDLQNVFICYGEPTYEIVEKIIFQRGKVTIEGEQKVNVDNMLIEELLGQEGFYCVQDCASELFNGGSKFDIVNTLFRKFELNEQKYDEGGAIKAGHVGAKINKFVSGLI